MPVDVIAAYLLPLMAIVTIYSLSRRKWEAGAVATLASSEEAGLMEPPTLHPVIDDSQCIGCGACVRACPEGEILGLIDRKAVLVEPSHCIGHGACKAACPFDAITLVFGTATRGVDIPHVRPDFQTNVPGIYIAGELGGMGLVRNAVAQGSQAMDSITAYVAAARAAATSAPAEDLLDVVIVGCGPAGLAASLGAKQHGLSFVTLEQETFGGTVSHYPRGKLVMTAPFVLPIAGKYRHTWLSKEELMALFEDAAHKGGLEINTGEGVTGVTEESGVFTVTSTRSTYRTRAVLLTIGRAGTPRKLNVPGEEQSKVVYRMIDPEQFKGRHVLVVGAGDSGMEAACEIADQPGTTVTLSLRGAAIDRGKIANRERVARTAAAGHLTVAYSSGVVRIGETDVELKWDGESRTLPNDAVIVCAGGILPTPFLEKMGIIVETKHGTP